MNEGQSHLELSYQFQKKRSELSEVTDRKVLSTIAAIIP